jgi:hypothetical protein
VAVLLLQLLVQLTVIHSSLLGLHRKVTRCTAPSHFCWRCGRTEMICDCLCNITVHRCVGMASFWLTVNWLRLVSDTIKRCYVAFAARWRVYCRTDLTFHPLGQCHLHPRGESCTALQQQNAHQSIRK